MNERSVGTLRRGEIIGGILYLPMYFYGSQVLAALIVYAAGWDLQSNQALARINLVFGLINLAVLGLIFFRYLRAQFRVFTQRGWQIFADTAVGLVVHYALTYPASFLITLLSMLFGVDYANANQEAVDAVVQTVPWMSVVIACLLAPPVEELICRGLIFCGLRRRSRFWAYALSMTVFSAMHVYGSVSQQSPAVSLMNLIVYLPAGWVLARAYERSGTIWTSICLHSAINLTALLLQALL